MCVCVCRPTCNCWSRNYGNCSGRAAGWLDEDCCVVWLLWIAGSGCGVHCFRCSCISSGWGWRGLYEERRWTDVFVLISSFMQICGHWCTTCSSGLGFSTIGLFTQTKWQVCNKVSATLGFHRLSLSTGTQPNKVNFSLMPPIQRAPPAWIDPQYQVKDWVYSLKLASLRTAHTSQ